MYAGADEIQLAKERGLKEIGAVELM